MPNIGIDLGTVNTVFVSGGQKIILDEPSVVAFSCKGERKVPIAVGTSAKSMLGKTPGSIEATCPLVDGVIANFESAEVMISEFFKKSVVRNVLLKPHVVVCVPYGATPVERRAIQQSIISAGARRVGLLSEPMAAALGSKLPWYEAKGSMIVDIGGGTTEIAVISLGGIVCASSLRIGGNHFDNNIIDAVRKFSELNIGPSTAERIKLNINLDRKDDNFSMNSTFTCAGVGAKDGKPKTANIREITLMKPLNRLIEQIEQEILRVLEKLPPDLAADVYQNGIMLTGGGALISGLDTSLSRRLKILCTVADNPKYCVAYGAGIATKTRTRLKHLIDYET